jgi:catechol 2,3-dioxygenase-like lactoylglutathione lyase family enzyme
MIQSALGPIGQLSRSVSDIATAEAWWRNVLGLPHLYTYGNLAFFDCDGIRLMLRDRLRTRSGESVGVIFENRSAAYIGYVSTGSAENCARWPSE